MKVSELIEELSKDKYQSKNIYIKGLTDPKEFFNGEIIYSKNLTFITLVGNGGDSESK